MTDDWDMPTGEYDRPPCESEVTSRRPRDAARSPLGVTSGELRMVDAFLNELAIEAAEDPRPPSAEEQLAIDDLRGRAERLKAMSPEELATERERLVRLG